MTAIDSSTLDTAARRARRFARINKADAWLNVFGLSWLTPILRAAAGDNPRAQAGEVWRLLGVPLLAIAVFVTLWATLAPTVQTSLGAVPGPVQVWEQVGELRQDAIREGERETAFYERQDVRNAEAIANGDTDAVRDRIYTGKPTYYDQIWTSIKTVFFGFLIASILAIPLGIAAGLSATANAALNPLIQIFKPVSPLAWLPIVTMIVSAVYTTNDGMFSKSFLVSAITVTLCSLWPTLINTALGVSS
ncbi:MAG: nitrate/nitrite transport system permease protein, partial [Paracoccaceae bacterium]